MAQIPGKQHPPNFLLRQASRKVAERALVELLLAKLGRPQTFAMTLPFAFETDGYFLGHLQVPGDFGADALVGFGLG